MKLETWLIFMDERLKERVFTPLRNESKGACKEEEEEEEDKGLSAQAVEGSLLEQQNAKKKKKKLYFKQEAEGNKTYPQAKWFYSPETRETPIR